MKLLRKAGWLAGVMATLIWVGCGDTYRPVDTPIAGPGVDPQNERLTLVLYRGAQAGTSCSSGVSTPPCPGWTSQIDVPGDVVGDNVQVGRVSDPADFGNATPIPAAVVINASENRILIFVANGADDTVSVFPSIFTVNPTTSIVPAVINLPSGAKPAALVAAGNNMYVADFGSGQVSVISRSTLQPIAEVPVQSAPVSLAAIPDGSKVYVANRDSSSVSVIATVDNTNVSNIPVGHKPISVVSNSSGSLIYVLSDDGTVSTIDTLLDQKLTDVASGSTNPKLMVFDPALQRLYVSDRTSPKIFVFDASAPKSAPGRLASADITGLASTAGQTWTAFAVVPGGSRIYVADAAGAGCTAGNTQAGRLWVVSTGNGQVTGCIDVGKSPQWVSVAGDGTKVYVPHSQSGNGGIGTTVVRVSSNQVIVNIDAPQSSDTALATPLYSISQ